MGTPFARSNEAQLSFHILETVMSLAVIHAGSETLEAVPVDVLSFPGSIDVISVGEIKLTIIVLGIVDTILSGTAVVPCHFQFTSSPPTIEKRAAKRANPVPIATGNTQYDMTRASYHWARASALNLMGLAALNLHKGIASLCTPARQKSEVCDLAQGSLTSSFTGFYKNSRRTSCKRNSRCSKQAAWITGYVMSTE